MLHAGNGPAEAAPRDIDDGPGALVDENGPVEDVLAKFLVRILSCIFCW